MLGWILLLANQSAQLLLPSSWKLIRPSLQHWSKNKTWFMKKVDFFLPVTQLYFPDIYGEDGWRLLIHCNPRSISTTCLLWGHNAVALLSCSWWKINVVSDKARDMVTSSLILSNSTNVSKFKLLMWVFYLHRAFFFLRAAKEIKIIQMKNQADGNR